MPSCCVCRRQEKLFRFPRDAERRNMWMHLIGKHNINDNSRICDLHFSEEAFETKRLDGKRKLKPNSVPNLCQYSRCQCVSEDTQMSENVTLLESNQYLVDVVTSMKTEKTRGGDGEDDFESTRSSDRQEEVIHNLRRQLKKAQYERNRYKKELENVSKELKICFNEDQMNYIKKGNARGHLWSENTMTKALKLYTSCGAKGFEEIRRQHIPLPSIRTIQHRIKGIQLKRLSRSVTHKNTSI